MVLGAGSWAAAGATALRTAVVAKRRTLWRNMAKRRVRMPGKEVLIYSYRSPPTASTRTGEKLTHKEKKKKKKPQEWRGSKESGVPRIMDLGRRVELRNVWWGKRLPARVRKSTPFIMSISSPRADDGGTDLGGLGGRRWAHGTGDRNQTSSHTPNQRGVHLMARKSGSSISPPGRRAFISLVA